MIIIHRRQRTTEVTSTPPTAARNPDLERINPVYAALLRVFGPPDSPDSELVGTKYDTRIAAQREREEFERRRLRVNARWQRWDERLHHHHPVPPPFPPSGTIGPDDSEPAGPQDRQPPG